MYPKYSVHGSNYDVNGKIDNALTGLYTFYNYKSPNIKILYHLSLPNHQYHFLKIFIKLYSPSKII